MIENLSANDINSKQIKNANDINFKQIKNETPEKNKNK